MSTTLYYSSSHQSNRLVRQAAMGSGEAEATARRDSVARPDEWVLWQSASITGYQAVYRGGALIASRERGRWTALTDDGRRWCAAMATGSSTGAIYALPA